MCVWGKIILFNRYVFKEEYMFSLSTDVGRINVRHLGSTCVCCKENTVWHWYVPVSQYSKFVCIRNQSSLPFKIDPLTLLLHYFTGKAVSLNAPVFHKWCFTVKEEVRFARREEKRAVCLSPCATSWHLTQSSIVLHWTAIGQIY